jgi:hypothetical protein
MTPDQALKGPNCLAMEVTTSAADVAVTNPDWRVPLLAYLLDEVYQTGARRTVHVAHFY